MANVSSPSHGPTDDAWARFVNMAATSRHRYVDYRAAQTIEDVSLDDQMVQLPSKLESSPPGGSPIPLEAPPDRSRPSSSLPVRPPSHPPPTPSSEGPATNRARTAEDAGDAVAGGGGAGEGEGDQHGTAMEVRETGGTSAAGEQQQQQGQQEGAVVEGEHEVADEAAMAITPPAAALSGEELPFSPPSLFPNCPSLDDIVNACNVPAHPPGEAMDAIHPDSDEVPRDSRRGESDRLVDSGKSFRVQKLIIYPVHAAPPISVPVLQLWTDVSSGCLENSGSVTSSVSRYLT